MAIRAIRLLGDPVLRTPCDPVTAFDVELRELVTDLMDTLLGAPGRAGLAANQIGVSARVFAWNAGGSVGHIVNPSLVVSEERQDGEEGCLSIPDLYYQTPRAMHASAHGLDERGEPIVVEGIGFLARALQHEVGHLDGQLFVDTLTGDIRRRALRDIRAAAWAAPTR